MSPQRLTDALKSCYATAPVVHTTVLHQKCTKQSPKVRSRAVVLAFLMNTPVWPKCRQA